MRLRSVWICGLVALGTVSLIARVQTPFVLPARPLPSGTFTVDSAEQRSIRVTVTKGLTHPWSLAFLPDGDLLVTERPGACASSARGSSIRARLPEYLPCTLTT